MKKGWVEEGENFFKKKIGKEKGKKKKKRAEIIFLFTNFPSSKSEPGTSSRRGVQS